MNESSFYHPVYMFYCNKGVNIDFFTEEKRLQMESLSQNKKHHMLVPNNQNCRKITLRMLISKHHMLLSNSDWNSEMKAAFSISKHHMLLSNDQDQDIEENESTFQNIICYYQTF